MSRVLLPFALLALLGSSPPAPLCAPSDFLTLRNVDGQRQLACIARPMALTPLPSCESGFLTTGKLQRDQLECVTSSKTVQELNTELLDLQKRTERIIAELNLGSGGSIVGVTKTLTTGKICAAGTPVGLMSANALCELEYPRTRICTAYDLAHSVSIGSISAVMPFLDAWIFHPSGKAPLGNAADLAGTGDNCASYTYDKDDLGLSGLTARASVQPNARFGVHYPGGSLAKCSSSRPIACCLKGGL